MNVIEAARLGRRYRATWALRDCTLAIPAGRVAALAGPNGAGKTTLMHMAVGLIAPGQVAQPQRLLHLVHQLEVGRHPRRRVQPEGDPGRRVRAASRRVTLFIYIHS